MELLAPDGTPLNVAGVGEDMAQLPIFLQELLNGYLCYSFNQGRLRSAWDTPEASSPHHP